jgi:hypothetical protein
MKHEKKLFYKHSEELFLPQRKLKKNGPLNCSYPSLGT